MEDLSLFRINKTFAGVKTLRCPVEEVVSSVLSTFQPLKPASSTFSGAELLNPVIHIVDGAEDNFLFSNLAIVNKNESEHLASLPKFEVEIGHWETKVKIKLLHHYDELSFIKYTNYLTNLLDKEEDLTNVLPHHLFLAFMRDGIKGIISVSNYVEERLVSFHYADFLNLIRANVDKTDLII